MTKSIAVKTLNEHFTGMMCCQKEWSFIRANIIEAQPKAYNKQSMPRCENCGGKLVTTCVNKKCDWSPVT